MVNNGLKGVLMTSFPQRFQTSKSGVRLGHLWMLAFIFVIGCSSPEEQAKSHYEEGMSLLKEGKTDKAQIEFKNALQINKNLGKAIYGMALVAEKKGDWQQMFKLLTNVLELEPKHLEAQVKLGKLLLAAGQMDKALEASNKAMSLNKEDADVLAFRAATLLKLKDTKGAIENANLALSKKPDHIEALVILAGERMVAGDFAKAIEYLDHGLKQNEKNVALQLIKIEALNGLAQLGDAEQVYRKLISFYPEEKSLRHALASFYMKHDRKNEAEAELRAFVKQVPGDNQAKLDLVGFLKAVKGADAAKQQLVEFASKEPENFQLNIGLVEFYLAGKDNKSAEAKLNEIIAKAGDSADGLKAKGMLAASMLSRGDKKAGEKLIAEILEQDKRNEQAIILKASLAIDAGKTDDAIADLRSILRDVPDSGRALLLLAQAHAKAGSPELADENFMRAFQASKRAAQYGLTYAQYLLKRNQAPRAEKILEDVLTATPGQLQALKMLAQARIAQGNWSGAQEVADEIKKRGDKENVADQIAGTISAGKRDFPESISAFKRAYEAAPGQTQPMATLVRAYLIAGKAKEAASFVDSVLKSNPSNIDARLMQGQLHARSGENKLAEESFNAVIKQDQKNPLGYRALAFLYIRNKQLGEAKTAIEQGLAQAPGDMTLRLTKAGVFELEGKYEDAIKVYEAMLKERPDADVVVNNLASLLSEHRTDKVSLDRALEISQRFKQAPVPQFKDTFGWASYKAGNYDDAKTALKSAAEQLPDSPIFHYHLGMTYLAKSDKVNARKELEMALQLAGKEPFEPAKEIQEVLRGL